MMSGTGSDFSHWYLSGLSSKTGDLRKMECERHIQMGWGGEVLDPIGRYIDYALCELPVGVLLLRACTYSEKKNHKFHQNQFKIRGGNRPKSPKFRLEADISETVVLCQKLKKADYCHFGELYLGCNISLVYCILGVMHFWYAMHRNLW